MKKLFSLLLIGILSLAISNYSFSQVTVSPGPATNYATLKAAFDAINAGTHGAGAIAVSINANTTEVDSAKLNGGVFTSCTVMPTATVSVTMTTNHPAIYLDGADNVTIDGRIGGTGSTRSLTINNYVTIPSGTNNVACVSLNNGATNNIVRYTNCRGSATQAVTGIAAAGGRLLLINQSLPGTGGNNNNLIEYNDVQGGARSLQCFGTSGLTAPQTTFYSNDNNTFRGNICRNARNIAIFVGTYCNGMTIDQNEITQDSALTYTAATGVVGIQIQSAGTINITRNYIHDWHNSLTTGLSNQYRGMIALPVWYAAAGFTPVTTVNIINNMVSLFTNNTAGTLVLGIQTQFSSTANIAAPNQPANYTANVYNNTCKIGGTSTTAGTLTESVLGNVATPTTGQVYSWNLYNNIGINERLGGSGAFHIGIDIDSNAILTTNADYNFAFATDPAGGWAANYGSFVYRSFGLSSYKDATCQAIPQIEQNTMFKNANFVSNGNLHLTSNVGGDMNGKPNSFATQDIDGTTRNALYPYRGCDEGAALRVLTVSGCLEEKTENGEATIGLFNSCGNKSTSTGYFDVNTNQMIVTFGDSIANATPYYLRVLSLNHLETWSASTITFSPNSAYNFITSGAFGGNLSSGGCILAGDVNQDSVIDATDMLDIFNQVPLILTGCRLQNDANSDQIVDATDLLVVYNNIPSVWSVSSPCPEPSYIQNNTGSENTVVRKKVSEEFNKINEARLFQNVKQ